MKILIADSFVAEGVEQLRAAFGADNVVADSSLKGDALRAALPGFRVLVVRSAKVPREAIEAAGDTTLIVRAGAGVDTIDVAAASERGIYVANCPGKNADAVAELAIGLMIALDRRIADNVSDLRSGVWNKKEYAKADGLAGKTLGLVGFGSIARAVAGRARAMRMEVTAWSRSLTPDLARAVGVGYAPDLISLARQSDILSIHIAGGAGTNGLVGKEVLTALPKGAMVVNTARASVLDHAALRAAIAEKKLRIALDVFEREPGANDTAFADDIVKLPGVIGTHHIGASTEQAQRAIAGEAVRIIRHYAATGEVLNCVNLCAKPPMAAQLIVRHYDRVGVLADVLTVIKQASINVQTMSNTVFEGAKAACARLDLDTVPPPALLGRIKDANEAIIHIECILPPQ